ncbi:MAG: hypothetical protein LBP61_01335 [Desulfovibrio sp.]|nr:hypothetical protein [Desulfovibrio sp.]
MSGETISNSAEFLFWNSNYSRIMNFHDALAGDGTENSRKDSGTALHPDVYFHLHFVPFVNGTAALA